MNGASIDLANGETSGDMETQQVPTKGSVTGGKGTLNPEAATSPPTTRGNVSTSQVPFWPIAIVVTFVFLLHGWIAEFLVTSVVNNGYSLGWFFALLTVLGQWLPTIPGRGWDKTDGFRSEHGIVGIAHCVSLGMSNSGGMLVEYNTYALFKSAKVVFVMIVSWFMLGVQASPQELIWGVGLMVGLLMLTGADETSVGESHRLNTAPLVGACMLFIGIGGSALVSVGQQAAIQRRCLHKNNSLKQSTCPYTWGPPNSVPLRGAVLPSKEDEREALLFWSNLISIFLLGSVCIANGELLQGVQFFREVATLNLWVAQFVGMSLVAFGQRLVLTLNGSHGATASAAVLTFRKVVSFVTSVMVFPKPFHPFHGLGLMVVVVSAVMIQRAELSAAALRKLTEENPERTQAAAAKQKQAQVDAAV